MHTGQAVAQQGSQHGRPKASGRFAAYLEWAPVTSTLDLVMVLRKLAKRVLILLGGPLIAFAVLFAGCEGEHPALGVMCGHNILMSLVLFTVVAWLVLGTISVLVGVFRGSE